MFIIDKKPKSVSAEAYRTMRTNIQYSSFDKEIKSILITSSGPSEGKSTTAGNLALSLAQGENSVVLIDCDLRKPTIHKRFLISNASGISDILVGEVKVEEAAYIHNKNLSVISSGKIPPNPSEMLASKSMGKLLEELKKRYDYIVIDAPPILAVTDAQLLSTKVDGTILVVRAGETKKEAVKSSIDLLNKVNSKILGTVLNCVDNSKNKYYYYYGSNEEKMASDKSIKNARKKEKLKAKALTE